jgi:prepilin-type N-terminal cleavage/methylation domain-containing protein
MIDVKGVCDTSPIGMFYNEVFLMMLANAPNKNEGFTLTEVLMVLVIAGILGAMATPSFLAMYEKNQVKDAVNTVQGALIETQREAMRKSKNCNITMTATTITSSNGCLITGDRALDKVTLYSSNTNFGFDIKGTTVNNSTPPTNLNSPVTIVLLSNSNQKLRRCVVLSAPLGLIRTGKYNGSLIPPVDSNCTP